MAERPAGLEGGERRAVDSMRRATDVQRVINELLRISLEPVALEEILSRLLTRLTAILTAVANAIAGIVRRRRAERDQKLAQSR